MRVVLDTNVLVSGLIATEGTPAGVLRAWFDGQYTLVSHELQVLEFRNVTRREGIRSKLRPANAGRLLNRIVALAEMPDKLPYVMRSNDPLDDFLLALCQAGNADWLVSGDKKDLLALGRHGLTQIATPAAFAAKLKR